MTDTVRVLRVVEYIGPRDWVETTLRKSIQGTLYLTGPNHPQDAYRMAEFKVIRTAVVGDLMEVLGEEEVRILDDHLGTEASRLGGRSVNKHG